MYFRIYIYKHILNLDASLCVQKDKMCFPSDASSDFNKAELLFITFQRPQLCSGEAFINPVTKHKTEVCLLEYKFTALRILLIDKSRCGLTGTSFE